MDRMGDDPAALIHEPLGLPGSGRVRYGAAMALYRAGGLGHASLEVYREAAAFDARDPLPILVERGLPAPPAPSGTDALQQLFLQARDYLNGCSHPGGKEVATGLARVAGEVTPPAPTSNPVARRWLKPALAAMSATHLPLADAIAKAAPHLVWQASDGYPPDRIGEGFVTGHAAAPLVGEQAPFHAREFEMGLFLIAPNVLCRDHELAAAALYAPLTGPHGWRFGPDSSLQVLPAHRLVWNPPCHPHLTKVGPVPLLCLYVRTGDVMKPARVLPAGDWTQLEALRLD